MERDAYHDAAFLCILLISEACPNGHKATLESDELEGQPIFPAEGWDIALGEEARRRGWLIEYEGKGWFDFTILCPECAKRRKQT